MMTIKNQITSRRITNVITHSHTAQEITRSPPMNKASLEVIIDVEEQWHLDLLAKSSQRLQQLTLTLRSSRPPPPARSSSSNSITMTSIETPSLQQSNHSDMNINRDCNLNLAKLTKLIENMHQLTNLRIYSEIYGCFLIKSSSLQHVVVQGLLSLEECVCPKLRRMDVSFYAKNLRHDHPLFKCMSPTVEELILRIDDDSMQRRNLDNTRICGSEENKRIVVDLAAYEEEIEKLLLKNMVRLKKLTLLPSVQYKFIVESSPSSPKSVWKLDDVCI
jgi:hypothetical protein